MLPSVRGRSHARSRKQRDVLAVAPREGGGRQQVVKIEGALEELSNAKEQNVLMGQSTADVTRLQTM